MRDWRKVVGVRWEVEGPESEYRVQPLGAAARKGAAERVARFALSLFRISPGAFARCPALRVCATASRMTGGAQASGAGGQAARMATAVERARQMTTPIRKRFAFFALEKPNGFPAATKA